MHRIDVHNIINAQCYFMFLDVECVEMCGYARFGSLLHALKICATGSLAAVDCGGLWRIVAAVPPPTLFIDAKGITRLRREFHKTPFPPPQ